MIIGIVIGLLLSIIKLKAKGPLQWFAVAGLSRNTPDFNFFLWIWTNILAGLSFNNAGYLAENFRGGFNAVPETQ